MEEPTIWGIISRTLLLLFGIATFVVMIVLVSNLIFDPDYKALYEEQLYNDTIFSAFNNGTIVGSNDARLQIIQTGSSCQPFSITAFHIPSNQSVGINLVRVGCP